MNLAGLVALKGGIFIIDHNGFNSRHFDGISIVIGIIFHHQNVGADLVFGQLEGAVADKGLGAFFPALALVH